LHNTRVTIGLEQKRFPKLSIHFLSPDKYDPL
jgi:hypothetical protein